MKLPRSKGALYLQLTLKWLRKKVMEKEKDKENIVNTNVWGNLEENTWEFFVLFCTFSVPEIISK